MDNWINNRGRIYWYDQYTLNEQETAFSKHDPDRIVDELLRTGADIIAVYATNQFGIAYYPSKIWPQHPGLRGTDYFGEILSRLHSHGKKVIAYINWLDSKNAGDSFIPIDQQDVSSPCEQPLVSWFGEQSMGMRVQRLAGAGWQTPCLNSPHRDEIVSITREIVELYKPDAFHLDMLTNGDICVCKHCLPELERICGSPVTRESVHANWRKFIDWRCKSSQAVISAVSEVVRNAGVLCAHNAFTPIYTPAVWGQSREWMESVDVMLSECFDAFLAPFSDLNATSINAKWQWAMGKQPWTLRTSTPLHFAHWPITDAQWRIHASACKANGVKVFGPCGAGARPDTTTSPLLLSRVKSAFDYFVSDSDLSEGAIPDSKLAVTFSWATRKYSPPDDQRWIAELMGWSRLLIEEHIPYDIIIAEDIAGADYLKKYDLVILPWNSCLGMAFCDSVRDYVRSGGKVIAVGETSKSDDCGVSIENLALSDVLGITWKECLDGHFAITGETEPLPFSGRFCHVNTSGETIAWRVETDPAGSVGGFEDPLPVSVTHQPAISTTDFDKGKSCYLAFDIGGYYSRHGDEHAQILMRKVLDMMLPAHQIEVEAPRTVEVSVWKQPEKQRSIVHLANRTVAWSLATDERQITEIVPLHNVKLRIPRQPSRCSVSARNADITCQSDNDCLVVLLSELKDYAAVIVDG